MPVVSLELDKKDIDRIIRARGIGMTWTSLAKAYGLPLQTFRNAVARTDIKKTLDQIEIDVFCGYEDMVISGELAAQYKIHLDKTRFKEFCEQEDKTPQVDITFTQELEEAKKDIAKALGEAQELVDGDISDFVSKDSTLGR